MTPRAPAEPIEFRFDVNPVPWKAPTATVRRNAGRVFAGAAPAPELVAYKEAIAEAARNAYAEEPMSGPLRVDTMFSRRQEVYRGPSGRLVVKHIADLDNMRKSTIDALQGVLFWNDRQVQSGWMEIIEQGKEAEGYVRVRVRKHSAG